MARCPLRNPQCRVSARPVCPMDYISCPFNLNSYPQPEFQQKLEVLSNDYLPSAIHSFGRDEELANDLRRLKSNIDSELISQE
jgi:hypothetical protein